MMKKFFLISAVVLAGFSSCRKDRTCNCSQNGTNLGSFSYINVTRSEGNKYCQSQQNQYQTTNPGTSCVLK